MNQSEFIVGFIWTTTLLLAGGYLVVALDAIVRALLPRASKGARWSE